MLKRTVISFICLALLAGCDQAGNETRNRTSRDHLVEIFRPDIEPVTLERIQTGTLSALQTVRIF